jgi:hypothetical protein
MGHRELLGGEYTRDEEHEKLVCMLYPFLLPIGLHLPVTGPFLIGRN